MIGSAIRPGTIIGQWRMLALCALLGIAGGVLYATTATPVYTSTARVLIAVSASGTPDDRMQGANYVAQSMPTFTAAATSSVVLAPVIRELALTDTIEELRNRVNASAGTDESVISLEASATSATAAQELAAALSRTFAAVAPGIVAPVESTPVVSGSPPEDTGPDEPPAVLSVTTIDEAVVPLGADSPILPLVILLGLVAGILVGVLVAIARQSLDRRVRSEQAIADIVGAPIIGRLPDIRASQWDERGSNSQWSEAVRTLQSAMFPWISSNGSVQFSSTSSGEGTSSTVAALGESLALSGVNVVAVDANLRTPSLQHKFGIDHVGHSGGLTDVLRGTADLDSVGVGVPGLPFLTVYPAGETVSAGEFVTPAQIPSIIDRLAEKADIVLVDTPAISAAADALTLAHSAGSIIFVVAINRVSEQALARAVEQVSRAGGIIDGIVVTHVPLSSLYESTPLAGAAASRL